MVRRYITIHNIQKDNVRLANDIVFIRTKYQKTIYYVQDFIYKFLMNSA